MADFNMPTVKVCGLTREADLAAAVAAGADAIGLVHYAPSPRHLAPERIEELARAVPEGVLAVLVLVDARPGEAFALAEGAGVGCLQLCGAEQPEDWADAPVPLLRRVGVGEQAGTAARAELDLWSDVAAGFVLDHASSPGGSGRTIDTTLAAGLARRAPCLLAGGLDADNVAGRARRVRPAGVDGSSRLESAPGHKDHDRVRAFVRAAREALTLTRGRPS